MTLLALVIATASLVLVGLMAYRLRAIEQCMLASQRAVVSHVAMVARSARRVDDRLTYYEHRSDGLKGLRAAYDKRLAKKIAQDSDAAPEGTAQAERLVG